MHWHFQTISGTRLKMPLEEQLKIGLEIKREWEALVNAMQEIKKDKNYNRKLKIPLTNLEADARTIYLCLNAFSSLALGPNQNLFTLVHDGKNVLKAYAESAEDGVYTSIKKIELGGWEKYVNMSTPKPEFLSRYKLEFLFHHLKRIAKEKTGIDIGILKMAHIDFFSEFQPYKTESKLEFLAQVYRACMSVYDKKLISFYPEPDAFKLLRQLTERIRPTEKTLEHVKKLDFGSKLGLVVKTKEGVIGLKIYKNKNDLEIETHSEFAQELELEKISRDYKKTPGLDIVIAFSSDELVSYLSKIIKYDVPWPEDAYKTIFNEKLPFQIYFDRPLMFKLKQNFYSILLELRSIQKAIFS